MYAGQKLCISKDIDVCLRVCCCLSSGLLPLPLPLPFCHFPCSVLLRHSVGQCTCGINLLLTSCPLCVSPGFMTYIVEPLFERWAQFTGNTPLSENMLNHLRRNKAKWRSLLHKQHSSSRSNDHSGQVTGSQEQTLNEEETP